MMDGSPGASLWSHLHPVSPGLTAAGPTVDHVLLCGLPSWVPPPPEYLPPLSTSYPWVPPTPEYLLPLGTSHPWVPPPVPLSGL